jgi:hypothetical protein
MGDRCVRVPAIDRVEPERQDAEERQARWLPIRHQLNAGQERLPIAPEAYTILATLPERNRSESFREVTRRCW